MAENKKTKNKKNGNGKKDEIKSTLSQKKLCKLPMKITKLTTFSK